MLFRFLLWILAWRINSLSEKSEGFKKVIGDYNVVLQFKTEDLKVRRYSALMQEKPALKAKCMKTLPWLLCSKIQRLPWTSSKKWVKPRPIRRFS